MSAALGTWTGLEQSKPRRIEGHTSNVEHPISYSQIITGSVGETTEAGDTYIIPHKFSNVRFIHAQPFSAVGAAVLYGGAAGVGEEGAYFADSATIIDSVQTTTAQAAGSTELVLTTSGSSINDVYNGCWLDIRFDNGDIQTVKITDYVGSSKTATLDQGLAKAVSATGTYYTVRGTLMTVTAAAATPKLRFEIIGSFE